MAIRIYQNTMSLNSQRHLGISQGNLGKSIERLSSGLRINHAADDASGLAISEKLRGQISGLKRASMNAQDGISMLQTAEGALGEVSSMLHRMRELAIQASNGTYTSNDRVEIQKEVEQLKDEINRISSATEFNTKKLLNGDGTALWSASSDKVEAIIRDNVAEGNYKIKLQSVPGQNQIHKTDIMTLREGAIGAEIDTDPNPNGTNVLSVTDPETIAKSGNTNYKITVSGSGTVDTTASITHAGSYMQAGSGFTIDEMAVNHAAYNPGTEAGWVELVADENVPVTADATVQFKARWIDAKTGKAEDWVNVTLGTTGSNITYTRNPPDGADSGDLGNLKNGLSANVTFKVDIDYSSGAMQKGDKILFAISPEYSDGIAQSGGGTIQVSGGPSGQAGPTIVYSGESDLTTKDNGDNFVDNKSTTVHHAVLNSQTGNIDIGKLTLNFKEQTTTETGGTASAGSTTTGAFDLNITGAGEAAATTTKLKDIAGFIDADGNSLFENKQELTVWGNGKSAVIYLEGDDTLADIETKMTDAIVSGLKMGSEDNNVNGHLVDYVSVPTTNGGPHSVKGTFIIQTALTGEQGEIAFSGDQRLIDGFALNEIQGSENNTTKVTVEDAHTGKLIGTDETGNDRVYGIIDGVEIVLDSRAGVAESWDTATESIVFKEDLTSSSEEHFLHVVDNSTDLQIGPNEGQTLAVSIPQLDVTGLGLDDIRLVSQKLAQAAIPDIDQAIDRVVSIRATIGAQINRLDYTISNLDTAKENMTASESRIRDLDMAEEMATFTRYQMLSQAGISMLSQANQIPQQAMQLLQ